MIHPGPGDRIGLAILNGSGKSNLVPLALGTIPGSGTLITPRSGTMTRHTRACIALYPQQSPKSWKLSPRPIRISEPFATSSKSLKPPASISRTRPGRGLLSGLDLSGEIASDVPIPYASSLETKEFVSHWQKVFLSPPHRLILVEVTTHFDNEPIQAPISALEPPSPTNSIQFSPVHTIMTKSW